VSAPHDLAEAVTPLEGVSRREVLLARRICVETVEVDRHVGLEVRAVQHELVVILVAAPTQRPDDWVGLTQMQPAAGT
jgi:hypothetical protein